jgi:hypothetical protein
MNIINFLMLILNYINIFFNKIHFIKNSNEKYLCNKNMFNSNPNKTSNQIESSSLNNENIQFVCNQHRSFQDNLKIEPKKILFFVNDFNNIFII